MSASNNGICANLYSTKAHVFEINPDTKNSWIPRGDSSVSFVASLPSHGISGELSKRELKLVGTGDNGEQVLDAIILPRTIFTKRSQKFGQWTDHTGMVYGLGFASEPELDEFFETFQQLQRDILSNVSSSQQQQTSHMSKASNQSDRLASWSHQNPNNTSETNGRQTSEGLNVTQHQQQYSNTLAHPGHLQQQQQQSLKRHQVGMNSSLKSTQNELVGDSQVSSYPRSQSMFGIRAGGNSGNNNNNPETKNQNALETDTSAGPASEWQIKEQLRYENERLKEALEESSKNAAVWNNELVNLRTNNVKLTQALQESKAHVEDWERELLGLRNENKELKLRIKALESSCDPEKLNEFKANLQKLYAGELDSKIRKKDDEIDQLQKALEELELKAQSSRLDETTTVVENVISLHQKQKFDVLTAKLEAKISEISNIGRDFSQLVDKMYH